MGVPLLYGLYTVQHSIKIYVVYACCHKQENQTNYARLFLTSLYFEIIHTTLYDICIYVKQAQYACPFLHAGSWILITSFMCDTSGDN